MSFIYDYYGQTTSLGGVDIPVCIIKTVTRMHFRGRQNEFFTPTSFANRLLLTKPPNKVAEVSEAETKALSEPQ